MRPGSVRVWALTERGGKGERSGDRCLGWRLGCPKSWSGRQKRRSPVWIARDDQVKKRRVRPWAGAAD